MGLKPLCYRANNVFLKNIKVFSILLIILGSCILISWGFFENPQLYGDGNEYLGMTVSFLNHGSPDFRPNDTELLQIIFSANDIQRPLTSGYHPSLRGTVEASHFWLYSLFVCPVFLLFHTFSYNELAAFQVTNILLLLATLLIIFSFNKVVRPKYFWYMAFLITSPVLLYLNWPHAEVFSFCFVALALFFGFLSDTRNYYLAVFCSSLASVQNPPIIILSFCLVLIGFKEFSYRSRSLFGLILSSVVICVPYLYSYYTFHTLNPQVFIGAVSSNFISLERVISLLFDLNAGIISYLPIILILSILMIPYSSLVQKDYRVLIIWGVILAMVVGCTTTINWNSGMMYIFRYAIWIIPLLILIVVLLSEYSSHYLISLLLLIAVVSTGMITIGSLMEQKPDNYIRFNSISKEILVGAPSLYNPAFEIFGERATHYDGLDEKALPVFFMYNGEIRKIMTDEKNLDYLQMMGIHPSSEERELIVRNGMGYINMETNLSLLPIDEKRIHCLAKDYYYSDKTNLTTQFIDYSSIGGILHENGQTLVFKNNELVFGVISSKNIIRLMQFMPKINAKNQTVQVHVGNTLQVHKENCSEVSDYKFNMSLRKGFNLIDIRITDEN